jgi:hypothetical protein
MDPNNPIDELGRATLVISRLIGKTVFTDTPEDQALLQKLFDARDELNWTAQQLIAHDIDIAAANCAGDCQTISASADALAQITSATASAQAVLHSVTAIVEAGSSVLTKVA